MYSEALYKMEVFYKKKGGAKELLTKEKKRFILDQNIFFTGDGTQGFFSYTLLLLSVEDREDPFDRSPH